MKHTGKNRTVRVILFTVAAFLGGLLLGSWGLRSDLAKAEREIEELRAKVKSSAKLSAIQQVAQLAALSGAARNPAPAGGASESAPAPGTNNAAVQTPTDLPAQTGAVVAAGTPPGAGPPPVPVDPAAIEKAMDLWSLRAELAREGFIERTGLKGEDAEAFRVLITAMNLRLQGSMESWGAQLEGGNMPPAEVAMYMANELSGVMLITYSELDRKLPEDWRQDAGPEFDLITFVDPYVFTPLLPPAPPPAGGVPPAGGIE